MRTEDLIAAMAADTTPRQQVGARVARWFLPALALAGLGVLAILGFRADLAAAMSAPVTAMKWLMPLVVSLAAGFAVLRRSHPAQASGWLVWPLAAVGVVALVWLSASLVTMPAADRWPAVRGETAIFCLIAVPVIAVLPLAARIAALRAGASTAPMRSGALAGLAAGSGAAAIYALHCIEDSPLFFLSWYSTGILVVTAAGALAGRRWLHW